MGAACNCVWVSRAPPRHATPRRTARHRIATVIDCAAHEYPKTPLPLFAVAPAPALAAAAAAAAFFRDRGVVVAVDDLEKLLHVVALDCGAALVHNLHLGLPNAQLGLIFLLQIS
jgi:hypothetical protein